MNKNVIEIVSILIKRMLKGEDLVTEQAEIIIELEDEGFTIEDISEAFEVTFSEILPEEDFEEDHSKFYIDSEMKSGYNRVFSTEENFYFNKKIKSLIYKLNNLEILSADDLEIIIFRMMQIAAVRELKSDLIWEIINDVVEDSDILFMISTNIHEFDSSVLKHQRVN